ncbi:STAS domain-containing protein, partial [Glaciimonas sp. CA11.2]
RITSVDAIGCGLLLRTLRKLQKSGIDLILVAPNQLTEAIRSILCIGRRDETAAPWLLLLEILHLLNNEQAFEDVSIDYSITFEVSPPPFIAPKSKVLVALDKNTLNQQSIKSREHFLMPILIEGRVDELLLKIKTYAINHNPTLIDCSRLIRIDFNAAGQLMNGLLPIIEQGRKIELHEVNHLVAALFKVMGLQDVISISTRKN